MTDGLRNEYDPNVVSPPGETLGEALEAIGLTEGELAHRMGCPESMIAQIVTGQAPITPDIAGCLERVLGVPARFWLNREQRYREACARQQSPVLSQGTPGQRVG
jgi:addiction module HigA family antidote